MPSSSLFKSQLRRSGNIRQLEADAFFQGAHGVAIDPGLADIHSHFDQEASRANQESIPRQKNFEQTIEHVRAAIPEAEHKWQLVKERLGEQTPPFVLPLLVAISAVIVAIAEITMLAPALDVLDITDPASQVMSATGITLIGSLAFHFAWESLSSEKFTKAWRWAIRILSGFTATALAYWGILRGQQVAFAARLNDNPLGRFLAGHPIASSIFYVFITLGAPLMIAAASHYSFHHLRDYWEWKKANSRLKCLIKQKAAAQKGLEAEKQGLEHRLAEIAHKCEQWKASYRLHHERGSKRGAIQEPFWTVPLKATFAGLIVAALLFWAPIVVEIPAVLASWIAAFLYFRRQWHSPTPEEYFELEHVHFSNPADIQNQKLPSWNQKPKELAE